MGHPEFCGSLNQRTRQGWATRPQGFTYTYDRYGNRWYQTLIAGSGPQPSFSINVANNQITTSGYAYDAAGNMTSDGLHTYTYDAEGKILSVDNGATAQYVYNAFDQRVQAVRDKITSEYFYNANGQRDSIWTWNGSSNTQVQGQYYWGSSPVAFYENGQLHFQTQDWMGTERIRTTYNGASEGQYSNLAFGDVQTTVSGTDLDPYHFAMLDYDSETLTGHAQYRQYSPAQGRWMRPDPYMGSYDLSNPQSMNRYSYVLNNPLAFVDPLGLDGECANARTGGVHAMDDGDDCGVPCDDDTANPCTPSQGGGPTDQPGMYSQDPGGTSDQPIDLGITFTPPISWGCGSNCDALANLLWLQFLSGVYPSVGASGGGGPAPSSPLPPRSSINQGLVCTPKGCINTTPPTCSGLQNTGIVVGLAGTTAGAYTGVAALIPGAGLPAAATVGSVGAILRWGGALLAAAGHFKIGCTP